MIKKNSLVIAVLFVLLGSCDPTAEDITQLLTAVGELTEGSLESFQGEPFFHKEVVHEEVVPKDSVLTDRERVRTPYLAVAVDGSILALRTFAGHLRRSEDGGQSWGEIIELPFTNTDTNFIPDEATGDILVVRMRDGTDRQWRSSDHGKTWKEETITLKPNEVMKWLEQTGLKERGTGYTMGANGSESGITLRHGANKGRLIVAVTFGPHAPEHASDRNPVDAAYTCAIYSDDGGDTWQVSGFFPSGYTAVAGLEELSDGRIYYNTRNHIGYYDDSLARELGPKEKMRREAWSYDEGQTWEDMRISKVLPDGGGYHRGYGMKGGLVRLPVKDRDILIFSNVDTGGGEREKMTVWASFDGGETWPLKRLVYSGFSAYSSLGAGRPGTPSEGMIYLLFEGGPGPDHHYSAMQVARFNLSWILEGEITGDGDIPEWIK